MKQSLVRKEKAPDAGPGLGRGGTLAALTLFCLVYRPAGINTESLTMSTYYPSPFGVYQEMRTLRDVYLNYENGGNNVFQVGMGVSNPTPGARLHVLGLPGGDPPLAMEAFNNRGNFLGMRFRRAANQDFLEFPTRAGAGPWVADRMDMIVGDAGAAPGGTYLLMSMMHMRCVAVPYNTGGAPTRCPAGPDGRRGAALFAGPSNCGGICSGAQRTTVTKTIPVGTNPVNISYEIDEYPPKSGTMTCCRMNLR